MEEGPSISKKVRFTRNVRKRLPRKSRKYQPSGNRYIECLKKWYPFCKKDDVDCSQEYPAHKITYGEMTYEGIEQLYHYVTSLSENTPYHGFLDIGSGRGKLCLYMAAKPAMEQSVGIELVKLRYDDSLVLQARLERISPKIARKIQFIHSDIFDVDLKDIFPKIDQPIFVWMSNLCFEKEITREILNKIVNELPSKTVICFSKEPDDIPEQLEKITTLPVPMSWNDTSNVNIYRIKP